MTTLIERAAKALAKSHGVDDDWPAFVVDVYTVLRAIRELSEAMKLAGLPHMDHPASFGGDGTVEGIWRAMIDAALKEPTP